MTETEIKLRVGDGTVEDVSAFLSKVRAIGYQKTETFYERNLLFDTLDGRLTQNKEILRVRSTGTARYNCKSEWELTYKGKNTSVDKLVREEITAKLDSGIVQTILNALGFQEVFRYERWRTAFRHPNRNLGGVIFLDNFDLPPSLKAADFVELEGWDTWIDDIAAKLGYTKDEYITQSYREILQKV